MSTEVVTSQRSVRGATSASKHLENEARAFLQSGPALFHRAASYSPTLEELQSKSFTDYVRQTLLGVTEPKYFENEGSESATANNHSVGKVIELKDILGRVDMVKLNEGIAKVTLPDGWWDERGIGKDRTARGPEWSGDSRLGKMVITTPIKQSLQGIGGIYEFSMFELKPQTVADFRSRADLYRLKQIGSATDENDACEEHIEELARRFWRRLGPTVEPAVYGADLEGTLFDQDYASGWNINQLSSCLQLLTVESSSPEAGLPGVTKSYLYFGMWGACFAAHTEDMNLFSINYLHAGAPKYWYSIARCDAPRFESLAAHHFCTAASECPEFLRHKQYLLSPAILKKAGIKFKTQVQRAGDAIITFPGCYHFGFNMGFNVAESSNFAVPEWIPDGDNAGVCLCRPDSVRIDMDHMKSLLVKYEQYCRDNQQRISYIDWKKMEIQKQTEKEEVASLEPIQNDYSDAQVNIDEQSKDVSNTSSIIVQISCNCSKIQKRKSRNARHIDVVKQYRIAKKASPKQFKIKSNVLCFRQNTDNANSLVETESMETICLQGNIVEIIEKHARVNFRGFTKKEDEWVRLDSDDLFLDGGIYPTAELNAESNCNETVQKKQKKRIDNAPLIEFPPMLNSNITDSTRLRLCGKLILNEREENGFKDSSRSLLEKNEEVTDFQTIAAISSIREREQGTPASNLVIVEGI